MLAYSTLWEASFSAKNLIIPSVLKSATSLGSSDIKFNIGPPSAVDEIVALPVTVAPSDVVSTFLILLW